MNANQSMGTVLWVGAMLLAVTVCSAQPIRAFCVDFNWGPGGPNGFAAPGHWADAAPERHVAWYKALGANVIQTFAISCNGYAWYKGGKVPPQPGMTHDFLPEIVRLGHAQKMKVMGYFCVAANTRWGREHPDQSYGIPSAMHIPLTDDYLDYLASAIEEALRISKMDGFMVDWLWCPDDASRRAATGGKWLDSEKRLYEQLMGRPFPGEEKLTAEYRIAYERKAIERCWRRIHDAAKKVRPDCIIWLSCYKVTDPAVVNSLLFREVDWLMNEAPDWKALEQIKAMAGPKTRLVQCLVGWGDQHDARKALKDPATKAFGVYGFSKPGDDSLPLPVETYLSKPIEAFTGNDRNIAVLARFFHGLPF
jgi:hypothetical protein